MAIGVHSADKRPTPPRRPWWPVLVVGAMALAAALRAPAAPGSQQDAGGSRAAPPAAAPDDGHGRDAATPSEIPVRGWRDILMRTYSEIGDDRVLAVAAGVTFYALLALFPAIAALVSLYGLFADPNTISSQLDSLSTVLPGGATEIIGDQVKRIASKPGGSLSFALVVSLAISLWSANAGVKAVFDALNVVFKEKEKRSFVLLNAISLAFTLGALVIVIGALGAVVAVPVALNVLGLGQLGATLLALARWPLMLVIIALGLAVLYRFGPSRTKPRWRWVTWGSAAASLLWIGASALFSFYVGRFGSYNATYGSLGAAIGFMTWIWISSIVVLAGAELSAEMEHQTGRDTTGGAEKPLGSRGAAMADEVGAAR